MYDDMKYHEIQALAKERGLNAAGKKEELIERLLEDDSVNGTPSAPVTNPADETPQGDSAPQETPEVKNTVISPAQEAAETRKADQALRNDARKMKEHLESQRKVSIMIPFENGESPEVGKNIPFHVNLNGYKMDLKRGVYIEVPEQVADIIKERLESEGKIGSQWRIDQDARRMEALS